MKLTKLIKNLFSSDNEKGSIETQEQPLTEERATSQFSKQYYRGLIVWYCRLSHGGAVIWVNDGSNLDPDTTLQNFSEHIDNEIIMRCLSYLVKRFERCKVKGDVSDFKKGTVAAYSAYELITEKSKAQKLLDFYDDTPVDGLPLEDAYEDASIFNLLGEKEISMRLLDYAANNSFPLAMITKAMISEDESQFEMWLKRALETGDATAQYEIGCLYYYGDSPLGQDHQKAIQLFVLAANQGHPQAQCNLGVCYYYGQGCEIDYEEAFKWYKLSAEQNEANAFYNLGSCYRDGHGVDQDFAKAISYYEKAADLGHPDAKDVEESLIALVKQMNDQD